jgi:hypothetical protein
MAGKVYVFNCFNEPITGLSVAGYSVGNIPQWADGTGKAIKYTPEGMTVERSKYPTQKDFAIGENSLLVPWDSFTGSTTVVIPDPKPQEKNSVSLDDDLILFLCTNEAILLTTRGFVLNTFPMQLQASEE